jgi:hypothetical protein
MTKGKRGKEVTECYKPVSTILTYMKERLQIEKTRREVIMQGKRDWTDEESMKRRELDRMKSYILNNFIFPSMANLTVFLEYIAKNEELQTVFEDDLKELFFGKPAKKSNAITVFQRFIQAAITWNWKKKENANDFRLALIYCLEQILFQHLTSIGLYLLDPAIVNSVVSQDLARVLMWTKLLARNVDIDDRDDRDVSRPVLF